MAQSFDNDRLALVGDAVPVAEQVGQQFSASSGVLAYRRSGTEDGRLMWVDRRGQEEDALGGATVRSPDNPRLSPDGSRLALVTNGDVWGRRVIFIHAVGRVMDVN